MLKQGLSDHGLKVTATSLARNDWQNDQAFLDHLKKASLIVINGEGTLHHGREAGANLLKITDHPDAKGRPVALVNALYQGNPSAWNEWVSKLDLVAARDSRSAGEIQKATGRLDVKVVPDLSLSAGAETIEVTRDGVVFGDSVKWKMRRALAQAAIRLRADVFLPTKTIPNWMVATPLIGRLIFMFYNGVLTLRMPKFRVARDESEYLKMLAQRQMHVTGRFHAICLSLVTGTPFLAVGSNSWKIETLLRDAGLGTSRMVTPGQLLTLTAKDVDRPFSEAERQQIGAFLEDAVAKSQALFSDLAALAHKGRL